MGDQQDDQSIGRRLRGVLHPVAPVDREQLPALVAGWIELQDCGELDAWLLMAASPPLPSRLVALALAEHPAVGVVGAVDDDIAAALVDGRSRDWSAGIGAAISGGAPVEVEACSLSSDDDPSAALITLAAALRRRLGNPTDQP